MKPVTSRFAALFLLVLIIASPVDAANANTLSFGPHATLKQPVVIPVAPALELDFKKKKEIIELRKSVVGRQPALVGSGYRPMAEIFDQIEDNRPWWGDQGLFFFGPGRKSIDGVSGRSFAIVNPFMLLVLSNKKAMVFRSLKLDFVPAFAASFNDPHFRIQPVASRLMWEPSHSRASLTYNIGAFMAGINRHAKGKVQIEEVGWDFSAMNARDMGFTHAAFDPGKSMNVSQPGVASVAAPILDFFHKGSSCGYPGGCNNLSPDQPAFNNFRIQALPAHAVFHLWQKDPEKSGSPPDFVFRVEFI